MYIDNYVCKFEVFLHCVGSRAFSISRSPLMYSVWMRECVLYMKFSTQQAVDLS